MIYLGLTFFLFTFSLILKKDLERRQAYYIILLILFIFSALRYEVGCDWVPYQNIFLKAADYRISEVLFSREPFFSLILIILHEINFPYFFVNIASSFLFFIGVHALARRQPDPLAFLVLLFPILIINMPMSGIRQGAAIGILCIALLALIDKRPIKFLIWILISSGFHISALIFIFFLPFAKMKYNNSSLKFALIFGCFLILILFSYIDAAQWALSTYIGTGRESYGAIFRIGLLTLTSLYFFLFAKSKWYQTYPKDYFVVSLGSIIMFITIFIVPISSIISDRVGYFFIPIQAMIFARIPYLPFKSNHSIHTMFPYLLIFFIFLVWTQSSWHFKECYIPYDNIIFK